MATRHSSGIVVVCMLGILPAASMSVAAADILHRPGQPEVLIPQSNAREAAGVFALFESRYRGAGSPRIMVYWNRTLAPLVQEAPSTSITIRERGDGSLDSDQAGEGRKSSARWKEDHSTEVTVKRAAPPPLDMRRGGLSEHFDLAVEAGMLQALREAGALLIDRSAALRLTHLDRSPAADTLEMLALARHADLLLEVLITSDLAARRTWGYRVSVKDLRDGRLLAALHTETDPAASPIRHRGTPHGFRRDQEAMKYQDVGRELGLRIMEELASQLR